MAGTRPTRILIVGGGTGYRGSRDCLQARDVAGAAALLIGGASAGGDEIDPIARP